MLYKSLISLVMAFAAASSVAAAGAPGQAGPAGGDHTPTTVPSITPKKCQGHVKCCQSLSSKSDPNLKNLGGFDAIPSSDTDVFGEDCVDMDINNIGQWYRWSLLGVTYEVLICRTAPAPRTQFAVPPYLRVCALF
jgi:hypothetical protein